MKRKPNARGWRAHSRVDVILTLTFRDAADLVEGLDCLGAITHKQENPALRELLMKVLRKLDRVNAKQYEERK